jgi:hypothetical protein
VSESTCDDCGTTVSDALARTVRLSVDRAQVDSQRLCPDCFASWINRYEEEMRNAPDAIDDGDSEIIVD